MLKIFEVAQDLGTFTWDIGISILNLVLPKRRVGHVVPEGHPGFGGKWPEYIPPGEGDSRCSCPVLNAMANHGLLPRDGKNITFTQLNKSIRAAFNFSPTFCLYVPTFAARMLKRDYSKDTFYLKELDLHNGIEHDASLCREDSGLEPDQSKPHIAYIKGLLASATGKDKDGNPLLTIKDLSKYSSKRRADARGYNPEFSLSLFHKVFGSANSSTMLTIFGGQIKDLEPILLEERIPDGWESKIRRPFGLTFAAFNSTVLSVEFGINEKKYLAEKRQAEDSASDTATKANPAADPSD